MKNKIKTLGLICARSGSKGLKNKNIKTFCGKPLIAWSVLTAKKCKYIDYLSLSTDSKKIANIGKKYGANIDFLRPKKLSGDKVHEIEVWRHAIKFYNYKNIYPKYIFIVPVTSPLRNVDDLNKTYEIFQKANSDYHFAITEANPFLVFYKKNKPEIFSVKKNFFRRQDAPKVFNICTVGYLIKVDFLMNNNNLYKGKISTYEVPRDRSVDIDDIVDFKLAEILKKK